VKKSLVTAAFALSLAAPLTAASAQYNIGNPTDVCGGTYYTFCVSISAAQGTGQFANDFFITIVNTALHGSNAGDYAGLSITALGFNGYATSPLIYAASAGTLFNTNDNITDLSNFKPGPWVGGVAVPPPVKNGLMFNEFITFEFVNTTAATFNNSDLAFHAQAGPGGCSSKFEISLSDGTLPANGPDFVNSCTPVTSTPEPATLAMFSTGLAGMMGMGWRRRKRATDDQAI
jgi:hypothetical protein